MRARRDTDRHKLFTRRALMLAGGKLALFATLAGRMYYLQVVEADQYRMLAEENRINLRLLAPPRGRVFDRFGVELAANRRNYQVVLVPEQTPNVEQTLDLLAELVPIDERDRARVLREVMRKRGFVPITVADNLSWHEFARVNVNIPDLPGVQLDVGETRDYPYGRLMAHVVGYVAPVSEKDLVTEEADPLLELPRFRIGKSGIERVYDRALRGSAGASRVEVNAYGRVIRELSRRDGQPGDDVVLTIDTALQKVAMERMAADSAAAVVLDVHGGDVLALASTPSFDPNAFNVGLSGEQWHALINNERRPLNNKAVAGQYPPGSTFKVVVALAALEAGVVTPEHTVYCPGYVQLGKYRFHCWKRGGHGWQAMLKGIYRSCDVYFYDIAKRLGVDRIAEMAGRFGLGETLKLELPGERPGLVPSREWKLAVLGTKWQQGETLITGIGQGFLLATPLQLAVMTARIANGGYAVMPRLVRRGAPAPGEDDKDAAAADTSAPSLGLRPSSLALVKQGMNLVTNHRRGTAYAARIKHEGWEMAGKTGTAQVRRISKQERQSGVRKNEQKPWKERDHALFVAYAPVDKPRYAIAVVVEHGGGGSKVAAPIARDILTETQRLDPVGRPGRERFARLPGRSPRG